MKSRFEVKREESIRSILEASLELFSEKGFEKTTIRMIAEKAGISLGLLYNYFKSKEEVLKAIFLEGKQYIQESLKQNTQPGLLIETYIRVTVTQLKQNKRFWKLLHGIRLQSPIIKALEAEMNSDSESIQRQIEQDLVRSGIPFPGLQAKLLFATVEGISQHYLLQDNYPIDDVANLLMMRYK